MTEDRIPRSLARLLLVTPFASASAAALTSLALGGSWDEALLAGSLSGVAPAFALAALLSPTKRSSATYACIGLAAFLLMACYVYGRAAGYPTSDIRIGLSVVLLAVTMAAFFTTLPPSRGRIRPSYPAHGRKASDPS